MEIKIIDEKEFLVILEGRLDTTTAPNLEKALSEYKLDKDLVFDFKNLQYISSAGLRLLLSYKKKVSQNNLKEIVRSPNDVVMEVFHVTGFENILTIE